MLECRSCALRCMRAIAGDAATTRQPLQQRLLLTPHLQQPTWRRTASTAAAQQKEVPDSFDAFEEIAAVESVTAVAPSQHTQVRKSIEIENKKALATELKWLKDPLKLSEHVRYTLRCDNPTKALDLCRLASKRMECVVSWNAVIDWHMRRNKINDALKFYNEMKKRNQYPDSYTYSMILRGLGFRSHVGQVTKDRNVSKAIAIYNSMNAPNSRVKPNIIHTNATLNVCAVALDMDALWSIAAQMPEKGPQSADHLTYTIILSAVRLSASAKKPFHMRRQEVVEMKQKAVDEGKRVWLDVVRKWRAGEMIIDEELVGAMARLLLFSINMRDWDNVLDLVQQTMNVKRLIPSVTSPDRRTEHVPQEELPAPMEIAEVDEEGYTPSPAAKAFNVVTALNPERATSKRPRSLVWAHPGPLTLSFLVDACQKMRVSKTASEYWKLLTSEEYGVKPDLENFDRQLRLLALNRASARAAKLLLEDLPAAGIEPKNSTFRAAMNACQRDVKNPNVLDHATAIVDIMEKVSSDPDAQTLQEYLSLALTTNNGPKIVAVINRMDSIVHSLRSRMAYGPDRKMSEVADVGDLKQASLFLQTLIGTIDALLQRSLVPSEDFTQWGARRKNLMQFLTKVKARVEKRDTALQASSEPQDERRVGATMESAMGRDAWALAKFRYSGTGRKAKREGVREKRDGHFNPPRKSGGEDAGFGM